MVLFFRYWKLVFINWNGAIIIQHNSQNFHEIIFFSYARARRWTMTWQIQSTSWISVANSTPSIGSGHRYDHMTRTWTAPTGASSLRGKTTQAILRVHGKYPHGKGQQVPSTSKGRKSGRQCIFCWAGLDGGMAPSCQGIIIALLPILFINVIILKLWKWSSS